MGGGSDYEGADRHADKAGKMHSPACIATGYHRYGRMEHDCVDLPWQEEHGSLGAADNIPDAQGVIASA